MHHVPSADGRIHLRFKQVARSDLVFERSRPRYESRWVPTCDHCARLLWDSLDSLCAKYALSVAVGLEILTRRAIVTCDTLTPAAYSPDHCSDCVWCRAGELRKPADDDTIEGGIRALFGKKPNIAWIGIIRHPSGGDPHFTAPFGLCQDCRAETADLAPRIQRREIDAVARRALPVLGTDLPRDIVRVIWQMMWAAVDLGEALMNCPEVLGVARE